MSRYLLAILFVSVALLSACISAEPPAIPTLVAQVSTSAPAASATAELAEVSIAPTDQPGATPVPPATPTVQPTATPTNIPTATPTDIPTATPTQPPTATPANTSTTAATNTPTLSLTRVPTVDTKGVVLTLADLPPGFEAMPEEEEKTLFASMQEGTEGIGFQQPFAFINPRPIEFVLGFHMLATGRLDQLGFDASLQNDQGLLKLLVSGFGDKASEAKILPELNNIADASIGMTVVAAPDDANLRMDVVAFRRGPMAAFVFVMYPNGSKPVITVGDVARKLDAKAVKALGTAPAQAEAPAVGPTPSILPRAKTLKVAVLAPYSGSTSEFGASIRDGVLLATKEWNARGGVADLRIEPIFEDSQCMPAPAVKAAHKVIDQDKVHYIIGEVCSKASIPISEIANRAKVIQISPTSTNVSVTVDVDGKTKDYVFRACFVDPFQGTIGARFALNTLKARTAFVLYDGSNDYVKGLAEHFETAFVDGGGKIVGKEAYTVRDTDFSAILAKVADAGPDLIYLPDYYNIVNLVASQAKEKGITAPFVGGDGWDSSDLDLQAAAGGYFTNHYASDNPLPAVQNFVQNFKAAYDGTEPDALAALGYDAANLLFQAIQQAGADDTVQVQRVLRTIQFDGVTGALTFDDYHNPVKPAVMMAVTSDGVRFEEFVNP
jgi:branched-chain amino acid transport system substrate-binding protein